MPRPTRASWITLGLIALTALCGVTIAAAVQKAQTDARDAAASAPAAPAARATIPPDSAKGLVVAVIGDESVTAASSDTPADQHWPALVQEALDAAVDRRAATGAGYVRQGGSGATFGTLAQQVPANADLVVFLGGQSDVDATSIDIARSATRAYAGAKARAPGARLLVVGPVVTGGADPEELLRIRNALKGSAAIAEAAWVDPVGAEWLATEPLRASSLGLADQSAIADRMRTAFQRVLL